MIKIIDYIFAALLPVLVSANTAFAQSESVIDSLPSDQKSRVLTNAADELAMCSAFFEIASECVNNTKPGTGAKYEEVSLKALHQSAIFLATSSLITLEEAGREFDTESMSHKSMETVVNWFNRYKQEMLNEILTCQNLSLLHTKHLEPCIAYFQNPDVLLEKWVTEMAAE